MKLVPPNDHKFAAPSTARCGRKRVFVYVPPGFRWKYLCNPILPAERAGGAVRLTLIIVDEGQPAFIESCSAPKYNGQSRRLRGIVCGERTRSCAIPPLRTGPERNCNLNTKQTGGRGRTISGCPGSFGSHVSLSVPRRHFSGREGGQDGIHRDHLRREGQNLDTRGQR